jgi:hypothetical protein
LTALELIIWMTIIPRYHHVLEPHWVPIVWSLVIVNTFITHW